MLVMDAEDLERDIDVPENKTAEAEIRKIIGGNINALRVERSKERVAAGDKKLSQATLSNYSKGS